MSPAVSRVERVRQSFAPEAKRASYLRVESALAQAQGELGMIPPEAAHAICETVSNLSLDSGEVADRVASHGHSMMALVEVLAEATGAQGGWVHWGATTQNIQQTGDVVLLRDAHEVILEQLDEAISALANLAEETADVPMPARTHWQHAVPMTFGYKVAAWLDQLLRHRERLVQLAPRLLRSMTGGAAGTFASFGLDGPRLQARVAELLGLEPMALPSRAIVDQFAEFVFVLAGLCGTLQALGDEVQRLQSAEFGEARQVVPPGQVGSSTMPQKRFAPDLGPMVFEAATVRSAVPLALDAMQQSHEVDGARSVMMDRALETAVTASVAALEHLVALAHSIEIDPARMWRNLALTGGLINAEAVMLALAPALGRQEAHHVVHGAAQAAIDGQQSFLEALLQEPAVTAVTTPAELAALLDPATYTGLSAELARTTAERSRAAISLP